MANYFVIATLWMVSTAAASGISQKHTAPEPLSVHVLDNESGGNAFNMTCKLFRVSENENLTHLSTQVTDVNGRILEFLPLANFNPGMYRVVFETKEYFESKGIPTFFPFLQLTFNIRNPATEYHIPLLLSPFGFSTYRGG